MQELSERLLNDLEKIGLTAKFELDIRPYSKTYFGRYDPKTNKVTLYVYRNEDMTSLYSYKELLLTLIHEVIHCVQWSSPTFVRLRGVMHDAEFHRLYSIYSDRAKAYLLIKEVKRSVSFHSTCCPQGV